MKALSAFLVLAVAVNLSAAIPSKRNFRRISKSVVGECPAEQNENSPSVYFPDSKDCHVFYQCDNGKPVRHECAVGTGWSQEHQWCDFEANIRACGNGNSNGNSVEDSNSGENSKVWNFLQNSYSGNENSNENSGDNTNPGNPDSSQSSESNESNQEQKPNPSEPSHVVGKCPSKQNANSPSVYLPDSKDCHVFYQCDNGKPVRHECAVGTAWSQEHRYCDYEANIPACRNDNSESDSEEDSNSGDSGESQPCDSNVPEQEQEPRLSAPPSAIGECPTQQNENSPSVYLPDSKDCHVFYQCNHGVPFALRCALGTAWSQHHQRCDWEANVPACRHENSGENSNSENPNPGNSGPLPSEPSTVVGECPAEQNQNSPSVYLPDSKDCHVFYLCNHGVPFALRCALGTAWSQHHQRCDWEANVPACRHENPRENSNPGNGNSGSSSSESSEGSEDSQQSNSNESNQEQGSNSSEHSADCPTEQNENSPSVYLPDLKDCHFFYQCSDGVPIRHRCSLGTAWSQEHLRCDFEANIPACNNNNDRFSGHPKLLRHF